MAVLDRNFGTFTAATAFNVTRSAGSFGTGTTIVVAVFGNTVVNTPGTMTQRTSSVVDLGLYSYEKTGAGEAALNFTTTAAGSGIWFCWELSSGSTWLTGQATQNATAGTTFTTAALTPTAGLRHLLAVGGGVGGAGNSRNVTAFSDSFTEWADAVALAQDYPFAAAADRDVTADGVSGYSTTASLSATTQAARGGIILAYVNNAGDITAPSVPTGLATTAVGSTSASFTWNPSTDDTGVTGYELQIFGP